MALQSKTQAELEQDAVSIGKDFQCVYYNSVLYLPEDFIDGMTGAIPAPERTVWVPLRGDALQQFYSANFGAMFKTPKQAADFTYMVQQNSRRHTGTVESLLIRQGDKLIKLGPDGTLSEPDGSFVPNTLAVPLNEDAAIKEKIFSTLVEWLDDNEEEAHLLLGLAATALAPGWSAGKYVLLIGAGRNGKSVFLEMLTRVLGHHNCAGVKRQEMAESSAVLTHLNGALANVIFDGPAEFIKDSSNEKTLTVGEPLNVRLLFHSDHTQVQTNALFLEGLNKEPKTSDKTQALQARMMRFSFTKTYQEDPDFHDMMMSDEYVGALMSLLIDHYVKREDRAKKLKLSLAGQELRFEHMLENSKAVQYLMHLEQTDPTGAESLLGTELTVLASEFSSWRLKQNDISVWDQQDVKRMFNDIVVWARKSRRSPTNPNDKYYEISGFRPDAAALVSYWRGPVSSEPEHLVEEER